MAILHPPHPVENAKGHFIEEVRKNVLEEVDVNGLVYILLEKVRPYHLVPQDASPHHQPSPVLHIGLCQTMRIFHGIMVVVLAINSAIIVENCLVSPTSLTDAGRLPGLVNVVNLIQNGQTIMKKVSSADT